MLSDALFDGDSEVNQDDSQEDVMTPAELIAKLEEVSRTLTRSLFDNDDKVSESCV